MKRKGGTPNRPMNADSRAAARQVAPFDARWQPIWSVVILTLAIAGVYAQTLGHRFTMWDDPINIAENPHLNPATWESVAFFWREPYANLYVPLTYTFWSAEAMLAESPAADGIPRHLTPWVFHAGNLLLHVLSVLGVWSILRQIVRTELPALLGALLYAVHPLLVESVAWVTETKGLLAGALGWFAVWQHLLAIEQQRRPGHSVVRHALAAMAFGLALLAKPSAVSLPAMAIVLDVVFLQTPLRRSLIALSPWFVLAVASVATTWWQQSGETLHFMAPPLWQRPLIAGDSLAFYLWKTVWPFDLGIDHGRSPTAIFNSGEAYAAWLVPVVLAVAIYWTRERRAWWGTFAIFVVGILPVSGLIPFSFQDISTVADRYVYLAMFGPALAAAWFLSSHRQAGWYGALAVLALGWAITSAWQASRWRDDGTLFEHAIDVNPRSYVARTLLGRTLLLQPTPDLDTVRSLYLEAVDIAPQRVRAYCDLALLDRKQGRHFAALTQYQHAAGLDPQFAEAHHGIAQSLVSLGRRDEALAAYRRTLELEPGFAIGWFNMSLALRDNGDNEAAIGALRRAVELAPQMRQAHQELVRLLIVEGRADEVIAEFELELAAAPHDALLHDRFAVALMQLARYDEALVEVERAIELEPRDLTPRRHRAAILLRKGEIAEALEQLRWIDARQPGSPAALDLAWTLATHPAAQWRDGAEAVRLATSYGAQTNYADPRGNDVLAAAYAESGDFARAVELAGQALQSASDGGHVELADEIEARLVLYRQGLPYRSAPVP